MANVIQFRPKPKKQTRLINMLEPRYFCPHCEEESFILLANGVILCDVCKLVMSNIKVIPDAT